MYLINVNGTKKDVFEKPYYSTMSFTKPEQYARTKPSVFDPVVAIMWINVNGQKMMFSLPFMYKNRAM